MKFTILLLSVLFSTHAFSEPSKDLDSAEVKCASLKSTFDVSKCLDDSLMDIKRKSTNKCSELRQSKGQNYVIRCLNDLDKEQSAREIRYHAKIEEFKQKDTTIAGKEYLSLCNKLKSASESEKDIEYCKSTLQKAILGSTEIDFCEKSSSDLLLKRLCFMSIASKSFSFSDLNECLNPRMGEPSSACIERRRSKEIKSIKNKEGMEKQDCRAGCECVIGSYMKCPEGTYTFIGDKLSSKVIDSSRGANIKNAPNSNVQVPNSNSSGVGK